MCCAVVTERRSRTMDGIKGHGLCAIGKPGQLKDIASDFRGDSLQVSHLLHLMKGDYALMLYKPKL